MGWEGGSETRTKNQDLKTGAIIEGMVKQLRTRTAGKIPVGDCGYVCRSGGVVIRDKVEDIVRHWT